MSIGVGVPRGAATDPLIEEAKRRARRRRLVIAALLVVAVACGGAVYLRSRDVGTAVTTARTGSQLPANGALTILGHDGTGQYATAVRALGASGGERVLWKCGPTGCAEPASLAWAPDGRRVAISLIAMGGLSWDVGIHIVDIRTGNIRQIPLNRSYGRWRGRAARLGEAWARQVTRRVGCFTPVELAWSPDGSTLAYRCTYSSVLGVQLMRLSGGPHRTIVPNSWAFWPSWSPDGRHIAYSTTLLPEADSRIYTMALDGSNRRLVARGAAPAWSPDGRAIAYEAACGVRMVTPRGRDVTPQPAAGACGVGRTGRPVWSPDGTQIAISADNGTYAMAATGTGLRRLSHRTGRTMYRQEPGRTAWQPKR
jgi:hypothetical protein